MAKPIGISPKNPKDYLGPSVTLIPTVDRARDPTGTDYKYPIQTIWRNNVTFDEWILVDISSNVGEWRKFTGGGGGTVIEFDVDNGANVEPTGAGVVTVTGAQVAAATSANGIRSDGSTANTLTLQINRAGSAGAETVAQNGIAHFNSSQFTVSNGFVSLSGGSAAVDSLTVDTFTAPAVTAVVVPTTGNITVRAALVAAGTNPIRTNSNAASEYTIEAQTSQALTAADSTKTGLSNFDSLNFSVTSTGFVQAKSGIQPGVTNLGISYSSPTFTVHGANGTALSAANPAYVTLQSKTAGLLKTIAVTANQTFTDQTGTLNLSNFGVTAGVAWNERMPFYLYAVLNDAETAVAFMISRIPGLGASPPLAQIAQSGTPATTPNTWFSLATIAAADYNSNPALGIGSFRMKKPTTANRWTVQTFTASDGINVIDNAVYYMPIGQNGAAATSHFLDNGGTAPVFTEATVAYKWDTTQTTINIWVAQNGDGGTDGAGAVTLKLAVPIALSIPPATLDPMSVDTCYISNVTASQFTMFAIANGGVGTVAFQEAAGTFVENADFGNGARTIQGQFRSYPQLS